MQSATSFSSWMNALKFDASKACGTSQALAVVSDALAAVPDPTTALSSSTTTEKALASVISDLSGGNPPSVSPPVEAEQQIKEGMKRYVARMACGERIGIGMQKLADHRVAVERIAEEHGVPWQLLMAIWGIETNYGSFMGEHDVVTVLAQEAFQLQGSPLGGYIRRELLAALRLLGEGRVQVGFLGSEAGAVGQCQFMPSNYYQFARRGAEGHAGEEAPDIWDSPEDALASIANFLRAHGYRKGDSFGTLAVLPTDENEADEDASVARDEKQTSNSCVPHLEEDREELLRSMLSEEGDAYRNVPSAPAVGDVRRVAEWELAGVKMMRHSPRRPADQSCKLKLSAVDGQLALLTSQSSEAALFAYNRSLDYVAAVIHLANVLELENTQEAIASASNNIAMLQKENESNRA